MQAAFNRGNPSLAIAVGSPAFRLAVSADSGATFPISYPFPTSFYATTLIAVGDTFYFAGLRNVVPFVVATNNGTAFPLQRQIDATSTSQPSAIAFGMNGVTPTFLIGFADGSMYMSTDYFATILKLPQTLTGQVRSIVHNGNRFVVATSNAVYHSANPELGFTKATTPISIPQTLAVSPHG